MQERHPSDFRNQKLWQEALSLSVSVYQLTDGLGGGRSADIIAHQMFRAATSISANIAEGYGRYYLGANRNHVSIARGSCMEVLSWVETLVALGFVERSDVLEVESQCNSLVAGLTWQMRQLEDRKSGVREDVALYYTSDDIDA